MNCGGKKNYMIDGALQSWPETRIQTFTEPLVSNTKDLFLIASFNLGSRSVLITRLNNVQYNFEEKGNKPGFSS